MTWCVVYKWPSAMTFRKLSNYRVVVACAVIYGPFDRKWVFGVISGNLHVYALNYTLVFNIFLAKNAC